MTAEDLHHFREQLEAVADEIRIALNAKDPADESITPDNAIGRLTRMEAIQAQSMSADGRRRMRDRAGMVRAAIERLDKGVYGRCTRCGDEIARGRLEVMPETPLCMACAGRG